MRDAIDNLLIIIIHLAVFYGIIISEDVSGLRCIGIGILLWSFYKTIRR